MSNVDERSAYGPLDDAVPMSDPEPLSRLRKWGGDKLVGEMVRLFLAQAPQRIAAVRTGSETGAAADVERAAHALRSSSAQIGAMRVQALCAEIAGLLTSLEHELSRYGAGTESTAPS